jgi:two-component system response regulator AtoC
MSYKIYIIEDDPWYGELLKYQLSMNPDYEVTLFQTAKEGLNALYKKPDVVCIDYSLPDMTGEKLLQKINAENNAIPVVVISGQDQISIAINLLKVGARDYIIKDENTKDLLWNAILKIRENADLKQEVEVLKEKLEQKFSFEKTIIGQSPELKKIFTLVEKATQSNINVSITGETGTGKELIAKAIHFNSDRKKKPFVAVNMAAIPKDLVESELFGYEKGAFTGAVEQKIGKFEEAQGGTLFLDEIAEMDLNMQSKILRVLHEREVVKLGGNQTAKLDIRILSATNKNLEKEVKKGTFREDLYYRLIGLPIHIPPLRLRGNDILILARHFVDEFCKDNKIKPLSFSASAIDKLLAYNFPGNIRELKAIMDLAAVLSDGKEITESDITFTSVRGDDQFITQEKSLRAFNCDIINFFLKKYNNDVVEVAHRLDIGKSTIYNMIKNKEITLEN